MEIKDKYPWEVGMYVASEGSSAFDVHINLGKVVRLTKTKVFVKFGSYEDNFRRDNATHRIDSWTWRTIRPATEEDIKMIKKQRLCVKLSKVVWRELTLEQLNQIDVIIQEAEKS